ncbi:MAG: hypothetical protein ACLFR0_04540 [Alphaproteobacteria bacterium]
MFANKVKNISRTTANVVDGKLILSFPDAITPIVWQIDLHDAKSSAFEVVEEDGQFKMISKKQGAQKKEVIAPFATKESAVEALMVTSDALARAHGHIHNAQPSNNNNGAASPATQPHNVIYSHAAPQAKKGGKGWIFALVSLVLIIGLFTMANTMQPRSPSSVQNASGTDDFGQNASSRAGVPVSADDFLRAR